MKTVCLMSWRRKVQVGTVDIYARQRTEPEVEAVMTIEHVSKITHFPFGSPFYRGPHWHVIYAGGFRTNWPEKYHRVVSIA
jgi:hypothetical protein